MERFRWLLREQPRSNYHFQLISNLLNSQLEQQAMFFGAGDHGGGISRKELAVIREITAHPAGDPQGKEEFCRLNLPEDQVVVQEYRYNRDGELELTLQNSGEDITLELPGIGKVELPAYAFRTFRWK